LSFKPKVQNKDLPTSFFPKIPIITMLFVKNNLYFYRLETHISLVYGRKSVFLNKNILTIHPILIKYK
jgi:hypothetical protein